MSVLRSIERTIRRMTLALLAPERSGAGMSEPVRGLPERPRFLLIRIDRIGDAIVSTPTVRLLRERFPESRIDILLGEKNRIIAPMFPYVDNRFILGRGFGSLISTVVSLRRNRYDVVLNLHLNRSAGASTVARLARGTVLLEYPEPDAFRNKEPTEESSPGGDFRDRPGHVVAMTSGILKPLGIGPLRDADSGNDKLKLEIGADARAHSEERAGRAYPAGKNGAAVFMNVTASHPSRRWSIGKYAELAELLKNAGHSPVLCGAPEDAGLLREIASLSNGAATILEPVDGYPEFVASLASADLVLTPDTSTVHAAAAIGRPTVVLYSRPETGAAWAPWGVPHRTLSSSEGMAGIEVSSALDAVEDLLEEVDSNP